MWTTLRAAVKEKLEEYSGTGQPIVAVHSFHDEALEGFPSVTFEPSSKEEDFDTTTDNVSKYTFEIYVHQEMEATGGDAALGVVGSVLDTLDAAFREDYTLGGVARLVRPVPGEWGRYPEGQGWVAYGKITLVIEVEEA